MAILFIALVVLAGSIVESAIALALSGRKPKRREADPITEARYSRLGSDFETV